MLPLEALIYLGGPKESNIRLYENYNILKQFSKDTSMKALLTKENFSLNYHNGKRWMLETPSGNNAFLWVTA